MLRNLIPLLCAMIMIFTSSTGVSGTDFPHDGAAQCDMDQSVECKRRGKTPRARAWGSDRQRTFASDYHAIDITPFAVRVVDYSPAPGQWVNDPDFDDPTVALGAPSGAGVISGAAPSIVTLGGFGGSITLAFDHTVEDDPLNPFGIDAIVFGNAFWVGGTVFDADPNRHWAECATIEIALDVNRNGRPDPAEWFLIPGSHITNPSARYHTQTWDDDTADDTFPPLLEYWIPPDMTGEWTTSGFLLPADIFALPAVDNPSAQFGIEGIFGYAEYSPTLILGDMDADDSVDDPFIAPEDFYTVPDDPFEVGMTPGCGGGDGFDIAWAVYPSTGRPSRLTGFDFIRITTAVDAVFGELFELSAEIDAVADVAPDPFGDCDGDGDIDLADFVCLQNCFDDRVDAVGLCERVDREPDGMIGLVDASALILRMSGPR